MEIKIHACRECFHFNTDCDIVDGKNMRVFYCNKVNKEIPSPEGIPEFCPLIKKNEKL